LSKTNPESLQLECTEVEKLIPPISLCRLIEEGCPQNTLECVVKRAKCDIIPSRFF
jgi:hypothetical protein